MGRPRRRWEDNIKMGLQEVGGGCGDRQLHLKYLCNLARYWLQVAWGWHDSVETCSSVIICEIIVHLLVTVRNIKRCTVQRIEIIVCVLFCYEFRRVYLHYNRLQLEQSNFFFFNLHLLLSTRVLPPGYVTRYLQCVFFYSFTLHMLFPSCTCCLILFCCV